MKTVNVPALLLETSERERLNIKLPNITKEGGHQNRKSSTRLRGINAVSEKDDLRAIIYPPSLDCL
jgi:hypothetical protein